MTVLLSENSLRLPQTLNTKRLLASKRNYLLLSSLSGKPPTFKQGRTQYREKKPLGIRNSANIGENHGRK